MGDPSKPRPATGAAFFWKIQGSRRRECAYLCPGQPCFTQAKARNRAVRQTTNTLNGSNTHTDFPPSHQAKVHRSGRGAFLDLRFGFIYECCCQNTQDFRVRSIGWFKLFQPLQVSSRTRHPDPVIPGDKNWHRKVDFWPANDWLAKLWPASIRPQHSQIRSPWGNGCVRHVCTRVWL